MAHKKVFGVIRPNYDNLQNNENRFGGAMILLRDLRHTLSVDELNACLTIDKTKSVGVASIHIYKKSINEPQ